ncbi:hypothetical protein [Streptomyces sp. NPDC008150]|uniref:hypothetical protein n=1 Tax=Streptomyces sp. NPDC008150 TaxID=3364816 RepID=UPI0036E582B0
MSLGDENGYGDSGRGDTGGYGGSGQTRTRYPDRDSDPYGSQRRGGRSSSRGLVTVVGVVVVLVAAIAFANRGSDDSGSASGAGGSAPKASTTAPSGEDPVRSTDATGIPSGFAHTQQGAESAAANYAVVLVSADILKPTRRAEIVRQVFAADQQAAMTAKFDKAYSAQFLSDIGLDTNGNPTGESTYVSRTTPVGTKTTGYADTDATVDVWCTGVFGSTGETSTTPVSNDWFTMTLHLQWSDDDWKVDAFSQKDGPTPVNGDNQVSSSDVISKALEEFGGFTYAR